VTSIDVLTVLAPGISICDPGLEALQNQGRVKLAHYIVPGERRPEETRVEAIARARNRARHVGTAHFAMFLDSDVVLPPLAVEKLVSTLLANRQYAALGINYQKDVGTCFARHVAMGATLFYRPILQRIRFRADGNRCECSWCCYDLRRMGYCIGYLPGVRAQHLNGLSPGPPGITCS
jgi:hypothetical protein